MGEDEKRPKGAADWKAPVTGNEEDNGLSEPVRFFRVPDLSPQIGDEEKTPVVPARNPRPPKDTVSELNLADIQAGLRQDKVAQAEKRKVGHRADMERIKREELDNVFDDVASNRDAEVVGFIKRGMDGSKFESLRDFQTFVEDLFGGENTPEGILNLKDLEKGIPKLAEMTVELRVQIGNSRPIIEITLVNEPGQGARSGEKVTRVDKVEIQAKPVVNTTDAPAPKKKSLWASATTWVNMVRGKGDGEN